MHPEDRAGIYLSKAFFTTWSRSGSAASNQGPTQSRICSPLAVFHDLRRGAGRLNNTWEVDNILGLALNRKSLRRRAALLRPGSHSTLAFPSRSAPTAHLLRYQGLRVGGGFLGFWQSILNPRGLSFLGNYRLPLFAR